MDLSNFNPSPKTANRIVFATSVILSIAGLSAIYMWMDYDAAHAVVAEAPGNDGAPPPGERYNLQVELAGVYFQGTAKAPDIEGSWPSFRGPDATNIVTDSPPLAESWGPDGPPELWSVPVGDGYAAPTVLNGRVYLMDYDTEKRADAIRCMSLETGEEIWRRAYNLNIKRNHGMSRTIPAVTNRYLVTMGPKCHVVCLDSMTGDFIWGLDLQGEYGTIEPLWYAGQCPLIDNDVAIIAPCGDDVSIMGVDCASGEILWSTPNPKEWDMAHSSVIPMTIAGRKMYVYGAIGGMFGVSAEPETAGKLLWEIPWDAKVVAPSPVPAGDDLIFATCGYGRGSRLLKLTDNGDTMDVEIVYDRPPSEVLACEQQTPIFHDGLIYAIQPKDAGAMKGQFSAYTPEGELVMASGNDARYGLGPFLLADNKFYILDDHGELTMGRFENNEWVILGHADMLDGHDAWGPLAIAGSRLLIRDMNTLKCVELGEAQVASN